MNIKNTKITNNNLTNIYNLKLERKKHLMMYSPTFNKVRSAKLKQQPVKADKYITQPKEAPKKNLFSNIKESFFPKSDTEKKPNIFKRTKTIYKTVKKEFTPHL